VHRDDGAHKAKEHQGPFSISGHLPTLQEGGLFEIVQLLEIRESLRRGCTRAKSGERARKLGAEHSCVADLRSPPSRGFRHASCSPVSQDNCARRSYPRSIQQRAFSGGVAPR
jgi:hypothetical protein